MRPPAQLQATIDLLDQIAETKYPADRVMAKYFRDRRYIGSKDKAAISEHFYTILRQRLSMSFLLEKNGLSLSSRNYAALLLRQQDLSITDYFDGENYSPVALYAGDVESLNSIDFADLDDAPQNIKLNVPEWIASKIEAALGERYTLEMQASNERASTDIRVNTLKCTLEDAQELLEQQGHSVSTSALVPLALRFSTRVSLFGLPAFKQGWFEVQDQGSQLLALLSGVKAGDRVVDFCAGAGGKTLAMAAMMNNKGVIHACDVHTKRLDNLSLRTKRAGAHNVRVHVLSSEKDKWVKQQQGKADVVLIDSPCTGTGTWRRNPDSRWNLQEQDLSNLVELQQSILQSASRLVKPGGRLIYATCSLLNEENEDQIEQFLSQNSDFEPAELVLTEPLISNLDKVKHNGHQLRTFPDLSGTDGFYACCLMKNKV